MQKEIIIIFFLILLYLFKQLFIFKVCICTIGKQENLYVREFIKHYINYGVDKIFIYDNNELEGERFENIINDYIIKGDVDIINIRGKQKYQVKAFQDCLDNNYNKYDWLIFYDMDEFLYLKDFKNIKNFLIQPKFVKCQVIQLNMFFHTDNNLFYYDNRTLSERFKIKIQREKEPLKSIIKGNIKVNINCLHNINRDLKSCNGFGNYNNKEKISRYTLKPDYKYYYIDHYCFKSTEEFIEKLNRGSAIHGKTQIKKLRKIGWYFDINDITKKKIDFIEKYAHVNLSRYRKK